MSSRNKKNSNLNFKNMNNRNNKNNINNKNNNYDNINNIDIYDNNNYVNKKISKSKSRQIKEYGFNDPQLVRKSPKWTFKRTMSLMLAIIFICGVWFALDQKLLFGKDWISQTYDNPDWKTNEGNLRTYGAWDLETHVWKTEYIIANYPNFEWNPYWYMGMPLLKYYQSGFYVINAGVVLLSDLSAARAALLMIIFGHLLAALLTFFVAYKVSRRIWVSALCSTFVLSNTFLSIRSYGWEPITVVFLFLFPLGLYLFFKEPLRPFRFWLILVLGLSYLAHPLIWFSLCMIMGIYLLSIAFRKDTKRHLQTRHYLFQYFGIVILSVLIGGLQFFPQMSYEQVSSGAHMGIKYLPFYQVAPNIITLKDFFFDAGNLKGPGPIIMIAFLLLFIFIYLHYISKKQNFTKKLHEHPIIVGLAITLVVMVLFYYMERYNIFPMNLLRSIQYHRIIPEFVITAAVLVAALSNLIYTRRQKVLYYSLLVAFVFASGIIIFFVQQKWITTADISMKPEFVYDNFTGRITVPYPDQSFAVRNSFTQIPNVYGYYEQGITNSYVDEMFSVSSGYHNAPLTILYLKAANVRRLYVNVEEGERGKILISRLNGTLQLIPGNNSNSSRYSYFEIPLANPSFAQAISAKEAEEVKLLEPGCREIFQEIYCGSLREEFVSTDSAEIAYLTAYVDLIEKPYVATAKMETVNPNFYKISVTGATNDTAVIVKMTHDKDFSAKINSNNSKLAGLNFNDINNLEEIEIETIGPDYMYIAPSMQGNYVIELKYNQNIMFIVGAITSMATILGLAIYFAIRNISWKKRRVYSTEERGFYISMKRGDMEK